MFTDIANRSSDGSTKSFEIRVVGMIISTTDIPTIHTHSLCNSTKVEAALYDAFVRLCV